MRLVLEGHGLNVTAVGLRFATLLAISAVLLVLPGSVNANWEGLLHGAEKKTGEGLNVVVCQMGSIAPSEDINAALEDAYTASSLWTALYCNMHGYTYKRIVDHRTHGTAAAPHHGTWLKAHNLLPLLQSHDLVVVLDFDVIWSDLSVSLEEKLLDWKFDKHALVLQAQDPDNPENYMEGSDGVQQLNVNTGFMVLRGRHTKVHQLVQLWSQCIEEVEGCDIYRADSDSTFSDQSAWNKYVRPHLGHHELIILPCSEANGFVGNSVEPTCVGKYVSHNWGRKDRVADLVKEKFLGLIFKELTSVLNETYAIEHRYR